MTEYTAIYEAGESLAALLRSELTPEPVAKKDHIGLCEPQSPEDFQLTIWIYNIETVKDSGTRTGFQPDPDVAGTFRANADEAPRADIRALESSCDPEMRGRIPHTRQGDAGGAGRAVDTSGAPCRLACGADRACPA